MKIEQVYEKLNELIGRAMLSMTISFVPGGWEKIEISFDEVSPEELISIGYVAKMYDFEVRRYEYGLKLIRDKKGDD
jgi:hypothetical protein